MNPAAVPPFLMFDFPDREGKPRSLCFADPVRIVAAHHLDEVRPCLRAAQSAAQEGLYAAGYVAYEAAPAFDPALQVRSGATIPLAWFGLFRAPVPLADEEGTGTFQVSEWRPSLSPSAYDRKIAAIRAAIGRGETYQVNFTLRLHAQFAGDDFAFYRRLCAAQRAAYGAYLNLGRQRIMCASPELFFRWNETDILTRPMKGTAPRGRWPEEDAAQAEWLAHSEKNRAENLMIADLLRNDLGRIARIGTVQVAELFAIERYRTVFQMTSTITASTRPETTLETVFAALFPCGSVTGAPKIRTSQIIAALEDSPRGVYCGAIGYLSPKGEAVFNVPIRTVQIDSQTGLAEYGVGGGITWDSTAEEEYAETVTKAALLTETWPAFELLETLRLEAGEYSLLERHLERLTASARYFDLPLSIAAVQDALSAHAREFPQGARRVRLLVSQADEARVESQPLLPLPPDPLPVALSPTPVSSRDRFLYHKTTHRVVYEAARAAHPEVYDVLLWNERGELTEFTIGNLVLEQDGRLWTPPRASGLLAGTLRAELLDKGEIAERLLTRADLAAATRLWRINSVRGWVPARLVG